MTMQPEFPGLHDGRWLPLNSRRVTAEYLHLMAQSLGLPTSLAAEGLRQQVEGKLMDMDHEPRNVQVVVQERTKVELLLLLVDDTGVFVRCGPAVREASSYQEYREWADEQLHAGAASAAESGLWSTAGGQPPGGGELLQSIGGTEETRGNDGAASCVGEAESREGRVAIGGAAAE